MMKYLIFEKSYLMLEDHAGRMYRPFLDRCGQAWCYLLNDPSALGEA